MALNFPVEVLIILANIFLGYNNNGVLCQTPEEMRDVVLKANRDKYWPNLMCVPHGWSQNFTVELKQAKTSQELLDAGVSGLYKLEKITQKCSELMDKSKDKIDTNNKKAGCVQHCILRELGLVKNLWSQNLALGDAATAAPQIKQLLTAKPYPGRMNLNIDVAAGMIVGYIHFKIKDAQERARKEQGTPYGKHHCFTGQSGDEYTGLLSYATTSWLESCVDKYMVQRFPPNLELMVYREVQKEEVANLVWQGWPDSSCLNSRYDAIEGSLWNNEWNLYVLNSYCRDQYDFSSINAEFGVQASETCTKVCILEFLQAIGSENPDDSVLEKRGMYQWVKKKELEWQKEIRNHNTSLLLPNWKGRAVEGEIEKYAALFYDGVEKSLHENGIAATGAECYKTDLWNPVFRDVDMIFEKACQECKECKKPPPSKNKG